ncbi:MAG: glycine cleavage system protein GcvH [Desulfovibrionaceae bacterium]|nr:glycine cleavage system protein GcvH [Desulfovibrionaceae bacterium]
MYPNDLLYTKTHEWARVEGETATMGVTWFAQEQLGDLTFVELPEIGRSVTPGEEIGSVESVKAASEIYSPVAGEVIEVNQDLENAPELVNQDPYGRGWMVRIRLSARPEGLLEASAYAALTAGQDH